MIDRSLSGAENLISLPDALHKSKRKLYRKKAGISIPPFNKPKIKKTKYSFCRLSCNHKRASRFR